MRRPRDRRLARLGARVVDAEMAEIHHRSGLRATATIGAAVRCALAAEGIDPAIATRLREADAAEAALAAIPDTPELQRADSDHEASGPAGGGDALDDFAAETRRLAKHYEANSEIDLATAPLADLFAWCLSRRTIELHRSGDDLLLISCNPSGGLGNAKPIAADLSRKTMGLAPLNRSDPTCAREICC
jgi:hypothetical protein